MSVAMLQTHSTVSEIGETRGVFQEGHTSEDVDYILPIVSEFTGHHLVVVWDLNDTYGPGGDSQLCVEKGERLFSVPEAIHDWLYDEEAAGIMGTSDLLSLPLDEEPAEKNFPRYRISDHNLSWESCPNEELD